MLNLDSHNDDEICVGCAGAAETIATCDYRPGPQDASLVPAEIILVGSARRAFRGLTSAWGAGTPIRSLARVLLELSSSFEFRLASLKGGTAINAIPREATAVVMAGEDRIPEIASKIAAIETVLRNEYSKTEPDLSLSIRRRVDVAKTAPLSKDAQLALLRVLVCCPDGVIRMSQALPGVIELSSNIGIVELDGGRLAVKSMQRSTMETLNRFGAEMVGSAFALAGMNARPAHVSPPWTPDFSSPLLGLAKSAFRKLRGTDPQVTVTNGGLECKFFSAKYPGMDIISIGARIQDLHSPAERVQIASVERFWNLVVEIIESPI